MCKHPRLQRRGAVYWFRCKIPVVLIAHYRKREIVKSLKTSDPQEALKRVRQLSAQQDQEFERIHAELAVHKAQRHEVQEEDVSVISGLMVSHMLQADEEQRLHGMTEEEFKDKLDRDEQHTAEVKAALARGDRSLIAPMAEDFVHGVGYELPREDSDLYRRLLFSLLKSATKAREMMRRRDSGDVVDTPERPRPRHGGTWSVIEPANQHQGQQPAEGSLQALLSYWKGQGDAKKPKTLHEAELVIKALEGITSKVPPASVQKPHVVKLRDKLAERNAPGTVKKKLGLLAAMFQVALDDDQFNLTRNPCDGVKIRGSRGETKQRAPFTIEDLQRIFTSPVFTEGHRTEGLKGEAAYWLPLLALLTGARLNELGQLRVEDVKESEGIHYLHITSLGEGQSLKKGAKNWRRVPLHRELLRLGFLAYVADVRKAGHDRLFYKLEPDSHGHLTGNWSKRWNDYLDDIVGIDDKRKDFHSFRHGFKSFSRLAGIPEDQHDALTGHANRTVARTYGSAEGYPLVPLREAVDRLKFPGLDLTMVTPYGRTARAA